MTRAQYGRVSLGWLGSLDGLGRTMARIGLGVGSGDRKTGEEAMVGPLEGGVEKAFVLLSRMSMKLRKYCFYCVF